MLLKKEEASKNALLSQLIKIDEHLGRRGHRFLTGDTLCCFDCELMPRLQHIRVAGAIHRIHSFEFISIFILTHSMCCNAGKYFMDFDIPTSLMHLWRYMYHMYHLDAFTQVNFYLLLSLLYFHFPFSLVKSTTRQIWIVHIRFI